MEETELASRAEDSPVKIHNAWVETAKAGLLVSMGVAENAVGTTMLLKATEIRNGVEATFNVIQQMGATASPELIQQVADSTARLPEIAGGFSFLCAAGFFGLGTIQVFRTARRLR